MAGHPPSGFPLFWRRLFEELDGRFTLQASALHVLVLRAGQDVNGLFIGRMMHVTFPPST
jgi:hypothetical protein